MEETVRGGGTNNIRLLIVLFPEFRIYSRRGVCPFRIICNDDEPIIRANGHFARCQASKRTVYFSNRLSRTEVREQLFRACPRGGTVQLALVKAATWRRGWVPVFGGRG